MTRRARLRFRRGKREREVVAAVAGDAHDSVGLGAAGQEPGRGHRGHEVTLLHGSRLLGSRPHRIVRRQEQPDEYLAGPVRGAATGVVLDHRHQLVVPAERQALVDDRAGVVEVPQCSARQAACLAGRERLRLRHRAQEQRSRDGEAVRERAAVVQGRAVGREEIPVLLEVATETLSVRRGAPGVGPVAVQATPLDGVEVHTPARVVVELLALSVGVPAVGAVPGVDGVESAVDVVLRVSGATDLRNALTTTGKSTQLLRGMRWSLT
jgi:hypothetical protein